MNRQSLEVKRLLMGKIIVSVFILLFTLMGRSTAIAQDFLPERPVGMVNDFADMLTSSEEQRLESKLQSYRDTTTNAFVIATLESLEGYTRQEIATTLFNNWRMWEGERYNGVLILVSEQDREMQIEIGYGLEGAIPDAMANRIVNNILVPNFKDNNFYRGLDEATSAMIQLAAGEFEGFPQSEEDIDIPIDLILFFIILIFFLISRGGGRGKRRRRHTLGSSGILFYGGGFGGGFGGGGSGFSGGGGFGGFSGGGGFGSGGGGAGGGW